MFAEALVVRYLDGRDSVEQFLMITPEDHRIAVVHRALAGSGTRETFWDAESQWWAELELLWGVEDPQTLALIERGDIAGFMEGYLREDPISTWRFRTSDGLELSYQARPSEQAEAGEPLASVRSAFTRSETASDVPASAWEALRFLSAVGEAGGPPASDLLEILLGEDASAPAGAPGFQYGSVRWSLGQGQPARSERSKSPEPTYQGLLDRFGGIPDPSERLGDRP